MDAVYLCHISRDEVSLTHSPIDKHREPHNKLSTILKICFTNNVLIRIEQIYTTAMIRDGNKISNNLNDNIQLKIIISNGVSDNCSIIASNGNINDYVYTENHI